MGIRIQPISANFIRSALVRIHTDLFTIDKVANDIFDEDELTDFEVFVLILEDRRFLHHSGVDIKACLREAFKALTFQRFGGASTIAMQFVRTTTGYRDITLKRKLYEILLSLLIQFRYDKLHILRSYLNCAFFGSGIYGIRDAAWTIFDKSPDELNEDESAYIASLLVYPRPLTPYPAWERKVARRKAYALQLKPRLEKRYKKLPT